VDLVARVFLAGFDGAPADAAIALEGYDLRTKAWRSVPDILKPLRTVPKASRDGGLHQILFALNEPAILAVFAATAFFRLVSAPGREGGPGQVLLAAERVVWNPDRVEMDFGTVLFLGERGFVTVAGEGGAFCSGVALAVEDAALAAAQRRFYARPREAEEIAAERDAIRTRLAELEDSRATVAKALAACEAGSARLTRDNAALTQQAQKAAADLEACAGERARLTQQLAAATARTAGVEAQLRACAAERERGAVELTARTRALAAATAERDACAVERGKVTQQLAAATARIAEVGAALDFCAGERQRLTAELADRTKALAAVTAERDACAVERTKLTQQLAHAAARIAAVETDLKTCADERERLIAELAARTETLAAATAARDACGLAREALVAQLAEADAGSEAMTKALEDLRTEFRHAAEARAAADNELAACRGRTAELEAAIGEADAALEACRLAGVEADRRASAAEQTRTALNDRLLVLEAEAQLRASELAELRERVANEQAYVGRLRDSVIAETAKASVAAEQLEAVRRQHQSEAPTAQLIANLATSFGQVNGELSAGDIPYRLGRTDITLKTFISGDGGRMFLPDAAYRIDDAALSAITMELIPDDLPAVPAAAGLIVPDLLGLTETAVIRILSSLFLKADKAIESVVEPAKHGRALHQIPKPGATAERGQTVLVVYGAEEGA
jgi:chromosome segregation ATPase